MSDKEPRRRKKRKDLQFQRKDDTQTEDQIFLPTKLETKDSDQEAEEEAVVPIYQPSTFAKCVFILLFSGLIVSMSFIFISLHGTNKGEVDIFDDHHSEEIVISHDDHDNDEAGNSPEISFAEGLGNLLPGISRILSFNDEHVKEPEGSELQVDDVIENVEYIQETSDSSAESSTLDSITSMFTDIPEQYTEDTDNLVEDIIHEIPTTSAPKILSSLQEDELEEYSQVEDPEPEEPELVSEVYTSTVAPLEEDIDPVTVTSSIDDYSDFTYLPDMDAPPEVESTSESSIRTEYTEAWDDNEDIGHMSEDFIETSTQNYEEEVLPFYEKSGITNEADFEMRDELDELDDILEKSPDRALKKCEELLHLHMESPRIHYLKAQALDKIAEVERSNKHLEEAITSYQKVMSLKDVPEELYLLAGKRAADRMRFRGFMGKSVKLLSEMADKFPQNVEIKNLLAVGYLMIAQNKQSKKVLYEVLKMSPDSGFAKVHLGFILKTDDSNYLEAIKYLREGISSREPGVIDGRFYFHLGDALHRIGKQDEALDVYKEAVKEGLFLSEYQRSLYNVKGLTGKPWWNPYATEYAPYFKLLEKKWKLIRDEALSLMDERSSGFLPETEGLQETGDWKQFELFARGRKVEKNCLKAPKTCELVTQMPDAASCKRGQVKFSIMRPATHVWAHTGPTNCRLRSHLGLVIPEGASIRVANETRQWEEGKVILFDDSFEHEVWHNGNSTRLVLIVDFWHPELTAYQKKNLIPI